MAIPTLVQSYICDFGDTYTTIVPVFAPMGGQETALVSFFSEASKSDSSFVGMATFELRPHGTLGPMIQFLWLDGAMWQRDGER